MSNVASDESCASPTSLRTSKRESLIDAGLRSGAKNAQADEVLDAGFNVNMVTRSEEWAAVHQGRVVHGS